LLFDGGMLRTLALATLLTACGTSANDDGSSDAGGSSSSTGELRSTVLAQCHDIESIADDLGCGNTDSCDDIVGFVVDTGCLMPQQTYYDCLLAAGEICVVVETCSAQLDAALGCELDWCKTHADPRCPMPPHP
jgi:hypothetical protein